MTHTRNLHPNRRCAGKMPHMTRRAPARVEDLVAWYDNAPLPERTTWLSKCLTDSEKARECERANHRGQLAMLRGQVHALLDAYQQGYLDGIKDSLAASGD